MKTIQRTQLLVAHIYKLLRHMKRRLNVDTVKEKLQKEQPYLDKHVFYGLENLNNGFDSPSIKYFTEPDFEIVLKRVKELGLGIYGIEPWQNGEFYDVQVYEEYTKDPSDFNWYMKVFEDYKKDGKELQY